MPEMTEPYYVSMLKGHGFTPDPDDHQYGALGLCWKISQEIGEGSYWTYGQKDLYDIRKVNRPEESGLQCNRKSSKTYSLTAFPCH